MFTDRGPLPLAAPLLDPSASPFEHSALRGAFLS